MLKKIMVYSIYRVVREYINVTFNILTFNRNAQIHCIFNGRELNSTILFIGYLRRSIWKQ